MTVITLMSSSGHTWGGDPEDYNAFAVEIGESGVQGPFIITAQDGHLVASYAQAPMRDQP